MSEVQFDMLLLYNAIVRGWWVYKCPFVPLNSAGGWKGQGRVSTAELGDRDNPDVRDKKIEANSYPTYYNFASLI